MPATATKLTSIVVELSRLRASGAATDERSTYLPLNNLLAAVGATLRLKVFWLSEIGDQRAGHPDFGLLAAKQAQSGRPRVGQIPECGVVDVKSSNDDTGSRQSAAKSAGTGVI